MILKPVQFLYEVGSNIKNKLYDLNVIKKIKLDVPVLSIGNISVGGTGKTPCVQMLATELLEIRAYYKIAIVSRSYKASSKKPRKVDVNAVGAIELYGDEPCLLQKLLPQCSVWSGPSKYKTAIAALSERPDLIIIDDGFSHRKLERNFDLMLIDATAPLNYFQVLPVGRLRESFKHIARANAILITRSNLVESNKIEKIKEMILRAAPGLKNSIYESSSITKINDATMPNSIYAFCGLGNPASFKTSLEKLGYSVVKFKEFPDHYAYQESDLDKLLRDFKESGAKYLVTTEKDFIKILNHPILDILLEAKNHIKVNDEKKGELVEKIRQSF